MHWQVIINRRDVYNINAETKHEALARAVEGGLKPTKSTTEDFNVSMIHRQDYVELVTPGDELTTV